MSELSMSLLDQLDQLEEIILEGTRVPFTGGRLVNEADAVELLDNIREIMPEQINTADKIVRTRDEFISSYKLKAEEIIQNAQQQREKLVNSVSIRQEAERQVAELKDQTRQQCEQLLMTTRQQSARMDQEIQTKIGQLDHQFSQKRQQLEQEFVELNKQLMRQHDKNRQEAMTELDNIRQEGFNIKRDSQLEAERINKDSLLFRKQTQQQCELLINQSRQEAVSVQDGANRYADQTLAELEQRLKELVHITLAGRKEINKIQAIGTSSTRRNHNENIPNSVAQVNTGSTSMRNKKTKYMD